MSIDMSENTGITRRQFIVTGASAAAIIASLGLSACGGSGGSPSGASGAYKDGTYTGQSSTLEANVDGDGYGIITITIENGKIVSADFQAYLPDGTPKDKDYGKDGTRYAVAQKAVSTADDYVTDLLETGTPDGVDAVSGATYLYDQFIEATNDALSQAK